MKKLKHNKNNLVEVVFDDPAEFDVTRDENNGPVECRAVGWLEEKTKSMIKLVWLREQNNNPYVGLSIPRGCVKRISTINSTKLKSETWSGHK